MTLILEDGDWRWESTRAVPLERLEVVEVEALKGKGETSNTIPKRPTSGPTSFRFAVIADTGVIADTDQVIKGALTKLVDEVTGSSYTSVVSRLSSNSEQLRASMAGLVGHSSARYHDHMGVEPVRPRQWTYPRNPMFNW